jgi:Xaa-Pro dipeptidase
MEESQMQTARIGRVLAAMEAGGLTQVLVSDPQTIAYLTDDLIAPGERFLGLLLRQGREPVLFLNKLFFAPHVPEAQVVGYDDTVRGAVLAAEYMDHNAVLGVDRFLAAEFLLELQDHGAANGYRNASTIVDRVRACKDETEVARMVEASRLNDLAVERLRDEVRSGVTEAQLAKRLLEIYDELGADGPSFTADVSFGANAADPHHVPDGTVLQEGECVLFDIGCLKDDYCSDMTRTYYFGSVSDRDREIYETVKRANLAAEAMIRPGVRFCDIDATARKIIEDAGYGPYFTHRLGHSIGRAVHEWGDVSSVNTDVVEPGMIFSCEPGIYLPGETGVRIEDLCLVTEDGVRVLNQSSKELEILR